MHSHIIFFSEENIKRLINSEHILLDCTYVYPINYYQTLIIMYYDNILNKMIPGIFPIINNKYLIGYSLIFSYIKNYIFSLINNDTTKIKWISFTTDFEVGLYRSFQNTFNNIKNLKHHGCFFHYLKNIRKFLIKHGFTKKENESHYKYIINNVYKLPFIKDIHLNIEKEIIRISKKK